MARRQLPKLKIIGTKCEEGKHIIRSYVAFFALRNMRVEIRYCRKCGYEEDYREMRDTESLDNIQRERIEGLPKWHA